MIQQIDPHSVATVPILGTHVHELTVERLHGVLRYLIERRQKSLVVGVNAHGFNLAARNRWIIDFWNHATVVRCDGAGVVLAARLLGYHLPTRITYADWIWQLAQFAAECGYSIYLLGARPGIAAKAAERMCAHAPGLRIAGTHHGYFDKTVESAENQQVIRQISESRPDILIVGFGMPLQEQWLRDNWQAVDAIVGLTAGAAFDYASGSLARAPDWMTDHGMEWFGRLLIEPRRLWRRYVVGNPLFMMRVIRQRLRQQAD